MPRRLRIHQPGGFYHVTLRGNHQNVIFITDGDRLLLNSIVARAIEKFGARVHAYCWMSNHIHLVIQAGAHPLAHPMRQIAAEYARAMHRKLDTTGHFFERRYHAVLVDADSYLLELLRYVHLNPVRAGLVKDIAHYPWSSHHIYAGAQAEAWITTDFCLSMFGADHAGAKSAYLKFIGMNPEPAWGPSMEVVRPSTGFGRDEFPAQIQTASPWTRPRQSLTELILEACRRFEIEPSAVDSPVRDAYLTKVRAWIAHQAAVRRVATLSAVARALGRSEGTLRYAIRAYPDELE